MKILSKNNDLIIKKSDKLNSIVLINKSDYLDKIYNIVSDSKKKKKKNAKSSVVDEKHLNFIIGIEKNLQQKKIIELKIVFEFSKEIRE